MPKRPLIYDYALMLADKVGKHGCGEQEFAAVVRRLEEVHSTLSAQRREGKVGFFRIPEMRRELRETSALADAIRKKHKTLIVCGIGGSDLGARAIIAALGGRYATKKGMDVRFIGANTDPEEIADLAQTVDWKTACINVISKSGDTIEPMSTFLLLRDMLAKKVGLKKLGGHVVATTDAEEGTLRVLAKSEGYATLPVPADIGGRFSALTPVGLFPAACAGVDAAGLVSGARATLEEFFTAPVTENAALMFSGLHHDAYLRRFQHISVLMPYSAKLKEFASWFRQLWAESLGKKFDRDDHEVHHGLTPVAALGATDQHSQLQLYNEGPADKIVTFIDVARFRDDFTVPRPFKDVEGLAYMGGLRFSEIIHAEREATADALMRHKRPSGTITVPGITPGSFGGLMMLFMLATAAMGELMDINAYDQPGVEQQKRTLYSLLGRAGYGKK
jgi:glucose-6-phosphate isomerase